MAKRQNHKKRNNFIISAIIAVIALAAGYFGWTNQEFITGDYIQGVFNADEMGEFSVHFIDVGQGDCTLIRTSEATILVDAGEASAGDSVINYLKKQNVGKIDILIATHPHADHIGGMKTVIENFAIDKVIMPEIPQSIVPTTATYEKLLKAISDKGLKITKAKPGDHYSFGDLKVDILGPIGIYDDLNDVSVITKLQYKEQSLLLTGDAEAAPEQDLLASDCDLKATIFHAGHHGSRTSNSLAFLEAVNPTYTVISLGEDNSYGHPHEEALQNFATVGTQVYRTDQQGTVLFALKDGKLEIYAEK